LLAKRLPSNYATEWFRRGAGQSALCPPGAQRTELEDEKLAALRSKLTAGHPMLKQSYGSPLYGIKTGLNAAFVIDRATRDRLIEEDTGSSELLKPFLEGKDLKKWHAQPRELWLIFTRRGVDIEHYPAIKTHLEQYREHLEPKTERVAKR
jgi:hypothetical protein